MAPGSRTTHQSPRINTPINPAGELNELAGAQGPAKRSNTRSDEALTEALTPPEASIPPLIPPTSEDLFTKFMKLFIEMTQAREQLEPWECSFKAKTPEIYSGKSHMDCYHFCQQCKDYFETSGATGMNRTLLPPPSSVVPSTSDGLNTSADTNTPLPLHSQSSRPSSKRTSEAPRPLLTASGISLGRTPNISWKKPETRFLTFNTSNPSYQSLIRSGPPTN